MPTTTITPVSETIFEVKIYTVEPDLAALAASAASSAATAVNSANIAGAAASDAEEAASDAEEAKNIAVEKASEAASDRIQTGLDREAAATSAANAAISATEAAEAKAIFNGFITSTAYSPTAPELARSGYWTTQTSGTYTNIGGLVVSVEDLATNKEIRLYYNKTTNTYSKVLQGQDLGGYVTVSQVEDFRNFKPGTNLFNKSTATLDAYVRSFNGTVATGQPGWWCSDFIKVKPNTQYSAINNVRDRAFYTESKVYISGQYNSAPNFTTPSNAAYVRFSHHNTNINTAILNEGAIALPFEFFYEQNEFPSISFDDIKVEVILPDKIYAVVGDTLQLFYRGIIKAWNPYQYDIVINCVKGAWHPRYFEYTPVVGDIGTTTIEIKVKDNNGRPLGSKTCSLITKGVVGSPASEIKSLFLGDSLTNARIYPAEAFRRLTGSGGSPSGSSLTNINFVGRKKFNGIYGVEGNSGWWWGNYLTVGRKAITFTITAPSILPTVESIYQDDNGKQYTMWWDYSSTSIKMLVNDQTSTPPASGTLTKVSGTGDSTITYSTQVQSSGNPFWNDGTSSLDFPSYVNKWLGGSIDVVYVLLTWNSQTGNRTDFTVFTDYAKTLFSHIKANYPSIKIKLMGVQVSDLKGGVKIIGSPSENTYTDTYGLMVTALNMNKAYQALANEAPYNTYVEFVNVSSQVDSENNMPSVAKQVNTRNSGVTELIGTNDVHPSTNGYNQIADVVFRNFISNFCQ